MAVQVAIALPTYITELRTHSAISNAASDISCAKPPDGISPGAVEVDGGGGGAVTPTVGTSPARVEAERTRLRVIAIAKRFMDASPLGFDDARFLTSEKNRTTSGSSCKDCQGHLISARMLQALLHSL